MGGVRGVEEGEEGGTGLVCKMKKNFNKKRMKNVTRGKNLTVAKKTLFNV